VSFDSLPATTARPRCFHRSDGWRDDNSPKSKRAQQYTSTLTRTNNTHALPDTRTSPREARIDEELFSKSTPETGSNTSPRRTPPNCPGGTARLAKLARHIKANTTHQGTQQSSRRTNAPLPLVSHHVPKYSVNLKVCSLSLHQQTSFPLSPIRTYGNTTWRPPAACLCRYTKI